MLRTIIDATIDAVYVKDRSGRYISANTTALGVLGAPDNVVIGKDDAALIPAEEARLVSEVDREVMRTGRARTTEDHVTIAGSTRRYHSTKTPYRDHTGRVIGVIGISRDITERKSQELTHAWLAAIV